MPAAAPVKISIVIGSLFERWSKGVEIIGEAAYQMAPESRAELPDIPWDDIMGMRHRLVHAYFDINLDILWKTVKEDLPMLLEALEPLVPPEEA